MSGPRSQASDARVALKSTAPWLSYLPNKTWRATCFTSCGWSSLSTNTVRRRGQAVCITTWVVSIIPSYTVRMSLPPVGAGEPAHGLGNAAVKGGCPAVCHHPPVHGRRGPHTSGKPPVRQPSYNMGPHRRHKGECERVDCLPVGPGRLVLSQWVTWLAVLMPTLHTLCCCFAAPLA